MGTFLVFFIIGFVVVFGFQLVKILFQLVLFILGMVGGFISSLFKR